MRRYQIWSNMAERSMKFISGWLPSDRMLISAAAAFPEGPRLPEYPADPEGPGDELTFLYVWYNQDARENRGVAHSLSVGVGDVISIFEGDERAGSWSVEPSGFKRLAAFPIRPDAGWAVDHKEMAAFGCPECGYRSGGFSISGGGAGIWNCGNPDTERHSCVALAEGVDRSTIGVCRVGGEAVYPERVQHPRLGIPSHGRSDARPPEGEYFSSRGVGMDVTPGCFMCSEPYRSAEAASTRNPYWNNVAAFVRCKAAGERVVAMFKRGARLDYRDYEPDRVQVKIGACDEHVPNLQKLHDLTESDGIITHERLREATA